MEFDIFERFTALNNKNKKSDSFQVNFLKLPENFTNVLGRQVKTIDRPNITFDINNIHHKKNRYVDTGKIEFQPVSVEFFDDENAVTSMLLYYQIFRQLNKAPDINNISEEQRRDHMERDVKFDIEIKFFNSLDQMVEAYILHNCIITDISHSMSDVSGDTPMSITTTVAFDNVSINLLEEYRKLK